MLEVILARHGETDWNVTEVFRGRADISLNEIGLRQAELLGEYLRQTRVSAVYSSPLKRAIRTAEAIADYHTLKVNVVQGLIDFDYGEWQGLSHQEVKDRYAELYAMWLSHPERVKMPAGESLADVRERATAVVANVVEKYKDGAVVLVSHRVVFKVLICTLLGLDNSHFWNIRLDTCGITSFNYEDERSVLTRHNDTSHLKSLKKAPLSDF